MAKVVANNKTKKRREKLSPKQQEVLASNAIKAGEVRNPAGRPKGSRSVFAETFVKDFMAHWAVHGKKAMDECAENDPSAYIRVGASLMPKDFNLNLNNEAELGKLLDTFSLDQLRDLAAGLTALGASSKQKDPESGARSQSDIIH